MSNKQFTWWRRFHTPPQLPQHKIWKGHSDLLQRIEWGEFEYNQLSEQSQLEHVIFKNESDKIKSELKYVRDPEIIEEKIRDRRKLKNKRVNIMLEHHLEQESKTLHHLVLKLASEFQLEVEYVKEYMETFDGTTRELYYTLWSIANKKHILTFEEIDRIPRCQPSFPRHVLKDRDPVIRQTWRKIVKDRKIWNAYGN